MLSPHLLKYVLCAPLLFVPLFSAAQTGQATGHEVPGSKMSIPGAAVSTAAASTLPYRSAFQDYKAFQDSPLASWRAANDEVAQAGGMAGHAMSNANEMGVQKKTTPAVSGHDMDAMTGKAAGDPPVNPANQKPAHPPSMAPPAHDDMHK